jgi:hypothetical protein
MHDDKLDRLVADGWQVGTVAEFLELSPEEEIFIELKLILSNLLKQLRESMPPNG